MKKRIGLLAIGLILTAYLSMSCKNKIWVSPFKKEEGALKKESVLPKLQNNALELEALISYRLDLDDSKLLILTITNNSSKIFWVPGAYPSKDMVGCESINFDSEGEDGMFLHLDYGLCQFPDSYSKLLPNNSTEYILDAGHTNDFKNKFNVEIWAPWRSENSQRVSCKKKKEALGENSILIERIVGLGGINR